MEGSSGGRSFAIILGSLFVSAGIAGGMFFLAQSWYESHASYNTLSSMGTAEKEVVSDSAVWTASYTVTAAGTDISSGTEKLRSQLEAITAYLTTEGIDEKDITAHPVVTSSTCTTATNPDENGYYPIVSYDNFGNPICDATERTYSLRQAITVRAADVSKVTDLAQNSAAELASEDVVFVAQNVEYFYTKLEDVKTELLSEAMKSAQMRAVGMAQNSNVKLGRLQSVYTNQFNVLPSQKVSADPMNMGYGGGGGYDSYIPPYSDYGTYDTSTINKKVNVTVNATYEVL